MLRYIVTQRAVTAYSGPLLVRVLVHVLRMRRPLERKRLQIDNVPMHSVKFSHCHGVKNVCFQEWDGEPVPCRVNKNFTVREPGSINYLDWCIRYFVPLPKGQLKTIRAQRQQILARVSIHVEEACSCVGVLLVSISIEVSLVLSGCGL